MREKLKENTMELAYGLILAACDGDPLHVLYIAQAMAGTCIRTRTGSEAAAGEWLVRSAEIVTEILGREHDRRTELSLDELRDLGASGVGDVDGCAGAWAAMCDALAETDPAARRVLLESLGVDDLVELRAVMRDRLRRQAERLAHAALVMGGHA